MEVYFSRDIAENDMEDHIQSSKETRNRHGNCSGYVR